MKSATTYSREVAEQIAVHIASGLSLRKIQELDGMPNKDTVIRWTLQHSEFKALYDDARKIQAELLADEIIEIADCSAGDTYEDEDGTIRVNFDNINRSRLRVDTRKWYLSKVLPRFAERITQEHTGPGGAPLVTPVINVTMEGNANSGDKLAAALAAGPGTIDEGN